MITRIELSNGESFEKIIEVQEYIDTTLTTTIANIIIGKNSEGILPNITDIYDEFSASLEDIKIYAKDSELLEEYLSATLTGYINIRSVSKSYNYNSISVALTKV